MLFSFLRAASLRRWLRRPDCPSILLQVKCLFERAFGGGYMATSSTSTDDPAHADHEHDQLSSRRRQDLPHEILQDLATVLTTSELDQAVVVARYKHNGLFFARSSTHLGNSLVRYFTADGQNEYGSIKYIVNVRPCVKFVVQRHLQTSSEDPFLAYPDFPATIRSAGLSDELEAIDPAHVICHFARWTMPSGNVAVLPLYKVRSRASFDGQSTHARAYSIDRPEMYPL